MPWNQSIVNRSEAQINSKSFHPYRFGQFASAIEIANKGSAICQRSAATGYRCRDRKLGKPIQESWAERTPQRRPCPVHMADSLLDECVSGYLQT